MFNLKKLDRQQAAKHICLYEGVIAHLYLDTRGNVTVGAGFLVGDEKALTKMTMRDKSTKKAASRAQKAQEFKAIAKLPEGRLASWYDQHCHLYLPHEECLKLLEKKIAEFEHELEVLFSTQNGYIPFKKMPSNVQLALLDMAYNLGTTNLSRAWPKLLSAIRAENWTMAAKECRRKHVSTARNQATAKLFNHSGAVGPLRRVAHFLLNQLSLRLRR
ncbi:pesticin C-terminus-like muramidase [Pseudoalteromonas sp. SMS1]|uniref:pesticin C-terminus-like muramidase n=1 Tax=Pseudoalteromonas sp. SMS1 TaxID=2908894 RepID=UPI001F23118B|nr:pesticin C-terminus-like muramidase [Pseudoalteromonas sp. SMS1]MCF2858464.1 pesticin C-terminus-like muramidase [Pseudoalteromonas sp. SMS1]